MLLSVTVADITFFFCSVSDISTHVPALAISVCVSAFVCERECVRVWVYVCM